MASFSPLFAGKDTRLVNGSIGFVSQSGALGYGAVSLAFERGLGLGWIANTGNEADLNALEVMIDIAERPECVGVLGYVERLDDLRSLQRLSSAEPPIAILKAGRSSAGQRAAASHTGALATEDRVVDAALRQLGIVRADDVDELLDLGDAFEQPRRPAGPRVAVITTSGGSGILAADAIDAHGLLLAELASATTTALDAIVPAYGSTANPVDVTATVMGDPALLDRALGVLIDDPGRGRGDRLLLRPDRVRRHAGRALPRERGAAIGQACARGPHRCRPPGSGCASRAARCRHPHLSHAGSSGTSARRRCTRWPSMPADLTKGRRCRPAAPRAGRDVGRADRQGRARRGRHPGSPRPPRRQTRSMRRPPSTRSAAWRSMKAVVPGLLHKSEADAVLLGVTPEARPRRTPGWPASAAASWSRR